MIVSSTCRHVAVCGVLLGSVFASGQALAAQPDRLVTGPVSDLRTVSMSASMPAAAAVSTDAGPLAAGRMLEHLQLLLKRPAARQAALDALVTAQVTPGSASFHHWLTPAALRRDYGPLDADIATTAAWLRSHGLAVNSVSPTGLSMDVSGTAASFNAAFHTVLHAFNRNGEAHLAPVVTPSIPEALAPVVSGAVMSNFFPHPLLRRMPMPAAAKMAQATVAQVGASYTATVGGSTYYAVTPSDFATIYNENEAFQGASVLGEKVTGAGQTVVVAEQTNIKTADWNSFRSIFKLTGYKGTFSTIHPGGCADPGRTADEGEAAIDAEWASATAPDAHIVLASCSGASSDFGFGVMVTLQNLVEYGTNAAAISISYGGCEQGNGLTFTDMWGKLVEEGAAEGISIFVSSGDDASAGCDYGSLAQSGLAVNALASNPYNTTIGGTDFLDTALRQNSTYWSSANSSSGGSARSYIPEIPWDNSCSNSIITAYFGSPGPIQDCNNPPVSPAFFQNTVGGSGGQSLIYAKPSWQSTSLPGMPNDGVRDLPDISLFAANGLWQHFYLECMSDAAEGGVPCDYSNPSDFLGSAYGGTSFGAPDFAGIAALVAQYEGGRVGNMAPRLYQIAKLQFGNALLAKTCNSSNGNGISRICVFNDVTKGDNSAACQAGTPDCFTNANSTQGIGVLSVSSKKLVPAFPATKGYDLATGLGTINVTNLLVNYYQ